VFGGVTAVARGGPGVDPWVTDLPAGNNAHPDIPVTVLRRAAGLGRQFQERRRSAAPSGSRGRFETLPCSENLRECSRFSRIQRFRHGFDLLQIGLPAGQTLPIRCNSGAPASFVQPGYNRVRL